jgi:transcription-repair coupling factor (superfamily II helicase)
MRLKIDLYRRLARVNHFDQIGEFRSELADRFGELPEPVERMLTLAELKIDAAVWQLASVHLENNYLVLDYLNRGRIGQLAKRHAGNLRIVDEQSAYYPLPERNMKPDAIIALAKSVLRPK